MPPNTPGVPLAEVGAFSTATGALVARAGALSASSDALVAGAAALSASTGALVAEAGALSAWSDVLSAQAATRTMRDRARPAQGRRTHLSTGVHGARICSDNSSSPHRPQSFNRVIGAR
ncbi:MAG: hypothetical protein AAF085_08175 [Planctomycetota bacterium]